jgi:hypothetical protein
MFYTMHVRIGNEVRVGYFIKSFKRPFWISSKVAFLMEEPQRKRIVVRKLRDPSFTPVSDHDAHVI